MRDAFKRELATRGLMDRVRTVATGCFDACAQGITVVIEPDDVWYGGVTLDDVEEIIESHVRGGRPVERLRMKLTPLPDGRKLPLLQEPPK